MSATILDFPQASTTRPAHEDTPGIAVVALGPGEALDLNPGSDNVVCVVDGALHVSFDADDYPLLPGDQLTIRARERHRAWNPGTEPASVVIGEVQAMTGHRLRLGRVAPSRQVGQAA